MKNLDSKRFALAIFVVFALSFLGVALSTDKIGTLDIWNILKIAYKTIPIILLIIGLFIKYMWCWKIFQGWLVPFPNLNGTWQGTIQTTWVNPETGIIPGPLPVILTIKQSFTRMSCVMRTAEMTSRSFLADFWLDGDEQIRKIGYSYHSSPNPSVRHRSEAHDGSAIFQIVGTPVVKLVGIYWTGRKTTGELNFIFREKELLEEFPDDLTLDKSPSSSSIIS